MIEAVHVSCFEMEVVGDAFLAVAMSTRGFEDILSKISHANAAFALGRFDDFCACWELGLEPNGLNLLSLSFRQ
jgi:hypothetical protein